MSYQPTSIHPPVRYAPLSRRSASQSPSRSPAKQTTFAAHELDPLLSNLSPKSTLEALQATELVPSNERNVQDILRKSIAQASTVERALGIRAALAAQKLREWYTELSGWEWPNENTVGGTNGFQPREKENPARAAKGKGPMVPEQEKYYGSLPVRVLQHYEERIDEIREAIDALDVEELKEHVLSAHIHPHSRPSSQHDSTSDSPRALTYVQLKDFTAVITATILQALPFLARLSLLLMIWDARVSVCRRIPDLLEGLEALRMNLDDAILAVSASSTRSDQRSTFTREHYDAVRSVLGDQIANVGSQMDALLDTLEGREDTLPQSWIDELDAIESDFGYWAVQAESIVVENELREIREAKAQAEAEEQKRARDIQNQQVQYALDQPTSPINRPCSEISEESAKGIYQDNTSTGSPDEIVKVEAPHEPTRLTSKERSDPGPVADEWADEKPLTTSGASIGLEDTNTDTESDIQPSKIRANSHITSQGDSIFEDSPPSEGPLHVAQTDFTVPLLSHESAASESTEVSENKNAPEKIADEADGAIRRGCTEFSELETADMLARSPFDVKEIRESISESPPALSVQDIGDDENITAATSSQPEPNEKESVSPVNDEAEVTDDLVPLDVDVEETQASISNKSFPLASPSPKAANDVSNSLLEPEEEGGKRFAATQPSEIDPNEKLHRDPADALVIESQSASDGDSRLHELGFEKSLEDATPSQPDESSNLETPHFLASEEPLAHHLENKPLPGQVNILPNEPALDFDKNELEHTKPPAPTLDSTPSPEIRRSDTHNRPVTPTTPTKTTVSLRIDSVPQYHQIADSSTPGSTDSEYFSDLSTPEIRDAATTAFDSGSPVIVSSPPRKLAPGSRLPGTPSRKDSQRVVRVDSLDPENQPETQTHRRTSSLDSESSLSELGDSTDTGTPEKSRVVEVKRASVASIETFSPRHIRSVRISRGESFGPPAFPEQPGSPTGAATMEHTAFDQPLEDQFPLPPNSPPFSFAQRGSGKSSSSNTLATKVDFNDVQSPVSSSSLPSFHVSSASVPKQGPPAPSESPATPSPRLASRQSSIPVPLSSPAKLPSPKERASPQKQTSPISPVSTDDQIEQKISSILHTIPARIRLASGPTQPAPSRRTSQLPEADSSSSSNKTTRSSTPTPSITLTPAFARSSQRHQNFNDSAIRLYNLHNSGREGAPMKLHVRLVGERGERVMVRTGGGWADLGEWLRDYALHHGSRKLGNNSFHMESLPSSGTSTSLSSGKTSESSKSSRRTSGRLTPIGFQESSGRSRSPAPPIETDDSTWPPPVPSIPESISHTTAQDSGPSTPTISSSPLNAESTIQVKKLRHQSAPQAFDTPIVKVTSTNPGPSQSSSDHSSPAGHIIPSGATPLAPGGPKARVVSLSTEKQAWIEGMMGAARKISEGNHPSIERDTDKDRVKGTDRDRMDGRRSSASIRSSGETFGDLGPVGGTRRLWMRTVSGKGKRKEGR